MKTSYQIIAGLVLTALVAVTPSDCPAVPPAVIVNFRDKHSMSSATLTMNASKASTTAATTITVTIRKTISVPALRTIPVTSAPDAGSLSTTYDSGDYMTILITNTHGKPLYLSFASKFDGPSPVGDPAATTLPHDAFTQYLFPTGWAGRICVGPNLNPDGSKIEGSYTGPPDVDVSYVDGYSVPITCSSEGTAVTGCNIDLFEQPGITCDNEIDGPICLNSAQNIANGPAPPFFAACAGRAYTYPNDNDANVGNLKSTLVSCCLGSSCKTSSRQILRDHSLRGGRIF